MCVCMCLYVCVCIYAYFPVSFVCVLLMLVHYMDTCSMRFVEKNLQILCVYACVRVCVCMCVCMCVCIYGHLFHEVCKKEHADTIGYLHVHTHVHIYMHRSVYCNFVSVNYMCAHYVLH